MLGFLNKFFPHAKEETKKEEEEIYFVSCSDFF